MKDLGAHSDGGGLDNTAGFGTFISSTMSTGILDLPNETLHEITIYMANRQSLGSFMNCSSRLWRVCRRTMFREFRVTTRFGEEYPFAKALEFLCDEDSEGFTQLVRVFRIGRPYVPTYIDQNVQIHIGIITELVAQVPNVHTLRVEGFKWECPGCFLPLPSPHTGFAKHLTSLHIDAIMHADEGPSALCLMGLGRISSVRITECGRVGEHGDHPLHDMCFIPRTLILEGGVGRLQPLGSYGHLSGQIEHLKLLDLIGEPLNLQWLVQSVETLKATLLTLEVLFGVQRCESVITLTTPHAQTRQSRDECLTAR